uniref:Uncharacterized protein n=1 Tax=Oryza meridionalis TaxID=40149 RepID=A0A0E0ERU4_9ORYZ
MIDSSLVRTAVFLSVIPKIKIEYSRSSGVYGDERCNWCGSIISQFTDSSIQEGKACLFVQIPQALLERGSAPLRLIAFLAQMKFVPVHAVAELRIKSLRKANPWGIEIPV